MSNFNEGQDVEVLWNSFWHEANIIDVSIRGRIETYIVEFADGCQLLVYSKDIRVKQEAE